MWRRLAILALLLVIPAPGRSQDHAPHDASLAAALKSISLAPGFQIDTAAAEPLLCDPIAFDWGADGKLWVARDG